MINQNTNDIKLLEYRNFIKIARSIYEMDSDQALDYYLTCYSFHSSSSFENDHIEDILIRLNEWFNETHIGESSIVISNDFLYESIGNRLFKNIEFLWANNLLPDPIRNKLNLDGYRYISNYGGHARKEIVSLPLNQPNVKQLSLIAERYSANGKSINPFLLNIISHNNLIEAFTNYSEILAPFRKKELHKVIHVSNNASEIKVRKVRSNRI